jgi:hypothetical protein
MMSIFTLFINAEFPIPLFTAFWYLLSSPHSQFSMLILIRRQQRATNYNAQCCYKINDNEKESRTPLTADHCSIHKYTYLVLILLKPSQSSRSCHCSQSLRPRCSELSSRCRIVFLSYSIMSDTGFDSDSDSVSDSINVPVDVDEDEDNASISSTAREYCNRLRSDDPHALPGPIAFLDIGDGVSEADRIGIAQALQENTFVTEIAVQLLQNTKRSTKAFAKYVKASKHLLCTVSDFGW